MSAWMCSDAHFDLLATAWVRLVDPAADPQEVGQQLARDNAASIRARYGDQDDRDDLEAWTKECEQQAWTYRFRQWAEPIDLKMLAKQVACYRYQSCEGDWPRRKSYVFVEHMMGRLVVLGVDYDSRSDRSTTYDAYPWGVDEHPGRINA